MHKDADFHRGGARVGLGTGELRGGQVRVVGHMDGDGEPRRAARASSTDTTDPPTTNVPTVHAAIQILMAAPFVASARRSLLERRERPEKTKIRRRAADLGVESPLSIQIPPM